MKGGTYATVGIAAALIQLVDIAVHAATDQLEPIRVASNVLMLAGLAATVIRRGDRVGSVALAGCIVIYLILNLLFVLWYGITNPEQDGQLRIALIALVVLTVVLSAPLLRFGGGRSPSHGQ